VAQIVGVMYSLVSLEKYLPHLTSPLRGGILAFIFPFLLEGMGIEGRVIFSTHFPK
jgi:hypothetical protein